MPTKKAKKRGFAALSKEARSAVSRKGGLAVAAKKKAVAKAAVKATKKVVKKVAKVAKKAVKKAPAKKKK